MQFTKLSYSLNGFPSDLRHDGTLAPKVLIAQAQEVIDDKGCEESRAKYPGQQITPSEHNSKGRGWATATLRPCSLLIMSHPFRIQGSTELGQRAMDP